ncbi:hydroxyethylthiazole kinase [bacterium]|nr:hydroxyethylthiazole kinase [bacterium]
MTEKFREKIVAVWSALPLRKPLVLHLTNEVVMGEQAHATLAIGAAPLMTLHPAEVSELVAIADAIVLNIGTPTTETMATMRAAAPTASALGKITLLDPVGYGATKLRNYLVDELVRVGRPTFIKGNHGEIGVLGRAGGLVRGVDARLAGDPQVAVTTVAREHNCVAVSTGEVDFVGDGERTVSVRGGSAILPRVTGSGCWLGSVISACAVVAESPFEGAVAALVGYGIAAEKAAARAEVLGVGSFRAAFFDELGNLAAMDFAGAGVDERVTELAPGLLQNG